MSLLFPHSKAVSDFDSDDLQKLEAPEHTAGADHISFRVICRHVTRH